MRIIQILFKVFYRAKILIKLNFLKIKKVKNIFQSLTFILHNFYLYFYSSILETASRLISASPTLFCILKYAKLAIIAALSVQSFSDG